MTPKISISAALMLMISIVSVGQASLQQQLEGKKTLAEIMEVVDQFYEANPEDEEAFESHYLHWKRWEWLMSSRLGPGGEFVNTTSYLLQAMEEKERMKTLAGERDINSDWSFIGYSTSPLQNADAQYNGIGRVDRITFHPTNPNIIFLCTPNGGLWGTLDGGSTWNNLTDNLPAIGVSGFVITPSNPTVMYLLTGDGDTAFPDGLLASENWSEQSIGVLKSTDGGVSWHATGSFPEVSGNFVGYRLVQSPADPDIVLAATSNGIYRTTNGGTTWNRELSVQAYDIEFKPNDPSRVYASVQGDIYISTNSGDTWTSNSTFDIHPNTCGSNGGGRIELAVAPTSQSRVYLFAGPVTGTGQFCGLWLSSNSGDSFTQQSNTPNVIGLSDSGMDANDQSFYDLALACRTDLSTGIVVGGNTVWRSLNNGVSWVHATGFNEDSNFPYIHPDVHDLAYNPINHWLYAATDGGFYRSTDHGVTWTDLSPHIESAQVYHLAGWDGNVNKLMVGLQDNGVKYRMANSSAFSHIEGADGFDVVFNPDTGEPGYATINRSVFKFSDNGANSTSISPNLNDYPNFFKTIAVHNTNPDTVLVGAEDILKSTTGGAPWTDAQASGSWALTSCPSNSNRFYAAGHISFSGGTGNLYISNDVGDSWTIISNNSGFPGLANWNKITDVTVRPGNSATVWACFGGYIDGYKVVTSSNAGATWTNVTFNLPNIPMYALAIDNNNGAYAATDVGVFYLSPTASQWMPWSNGLPNTLVSDLRIFDDGTTKKIRASTFGRGVWESPLASACDPAVVVTGNLEGIHHYEAGTSISAGTGFVEGGLGTFVSFQSGSYINLTEGFNVVDDSEFLGFISPCGQGGIPDVQGDIINRDDPNSSIISLRRMWDPVDGLPYGSIEVERMDDQTARVRFDLKNDGNMQLVVARNVQEQLQVVHSGFEKAGIHRVEVDVAALSDAFHYLLLFYEGKLVHFQELVK